VKVRASLSVPVSFRDIGKADRTHPKDHEGRPIVSTPNGELTTRIPTTLFMGRDYDFSDL
jgi:hypothetical protein